MKKSLFAIMVLGLLFAFAVIPGKDAKALTGDGTKDNPYVIASADDLMAFRDIVNQVGASKVLYAEQVKDIVINDIHVDPNTTPENPILIAGGKSQPASQVSGLKKWTPIGTSSKPFCGLYNGNRFTIRGVFIDEPGKDCMGLFGYCYCATIWDTFLGDSFIRGGTGTGGLCGYGRNTRFYNSCYDDDELFGQYPSYVIGNAAVGGICGYYMDMVKENGNEIYGYHRDHYKRADGSKGLVMFDHILNRSNVIGNQCVGGICGYAFCFGYNKESVKNFGTVYSADNKTAGDIVAYNLEEDQIKKMKSNSGTRKGSKRPSTPSTSGGSGKDTLGEGTGDEGGSKIDKESDEDASKEREKNEKIAEGVLTDGTGYVASVFNDSPHNVAAWIFTFGGSFLLIVALVVALILKKKKAKVQE